MFKYGFYQNGKPIRKNERVLFRNREDLKNYFHNPFSDECYLWMQKNCVEKEDIDLLIKKIISAWFSYKTSLFGRRKRKKKIYKDYVERLKKIISV